MFDMLTNRLRSRLKAVCGQSRLTEANIKESLHEVKTALLEADVALSVVQAFIEDVRSHALGEQVLLSLSPGQVFVKIVYNALIKIMGEYCTTLNLVDQRPPTVILLVGLQGSGKTTTVAKLARRLKEQENKSVLVTSTDTHRPAAIEQLAKLAQEVGVSFHPNDIGQPPLAIAQTAIEAARTQATDILIVDSAGRLPGDNSRMEALQQLQLAIAPVETLLVVDSMSGQGAAVTAQAFNQRLQLTGVILTKMDSDARGGAALSVRFITHQPIKFIGTGEKTQALEPFYPDRIASRILGMGDILSLVEDVQRNTDQQQVQKLAAKISQGKEFNLEDLLNQLLQMKNMGGMAKLLDKLPGMGTLANARKSLVSDKQLQQMIAILRAMTPKERCFPALIRDSRKQRIAKGSGTQLRDINGLLKQFEHMKKTMKRFTKVGGNAQKLLQGLQDY